MSEKSIVLSWTLPKWTSSQADMEDVSTVDHFPLDNPPEKGGPGSNCKYRLWMVVRERLGTVSFLAAVGLLFLMAYVVLSRLFFFKTPFVGVSMATVLYFAGAVRAFVRL